MSSRWLVSLAVAVIVLGGCASIPEVAPGVVWVAEFNSSKFGPVSNAFSHAGDCAAWRQQYRATRCLRAELGGGGDRWLFPVRFAGGEPVKVYFGAPSRDTCEAITTTLPRGNIQAAGGCQPYRVME